MVDRLKDSVSIVWAVLQRYKLDAADQLAAAIGYFAFISFVPLLLLAVSAFGFIVSDPDRQVEVALALTQALPGFEDTVQQPDSQIGQLIAGVVDARGTVGLVGAITLLLTGIKVVASIMTATRVVFRGQVLRGVMARLRAVGALGMLGIVALAVVGGSSATTVATLSVLPASVAVVASFAITALFDTLLFLAAYKILSPTAALTWRQLLPGAVLAGIGWAALKVVSSTIVANQIDSANALYGALGSVFALLLLLYLAGRLYLYGAELSAVLAERRVGPLVELHGPAEPPPDPVERLETLAGKVRRRGDSAGDPDPAPDDPPASDDQPASDGPPPPPDPGRDARTTVSLGLAAAAAVAVWRLGRRD